MNWNSVLGFVVRQGRSRLVQDQEPGRSRQCPGDLDDLAFTDSQGRDAASRVDVDAELIEDLASLAVDGPPVDDPEPIGDPAERDVLGHGQRRGVLELLEDDRDPEIARRDRGEGRIAGLVDEDRPFVGRVVAGDDLDQRGLAGPVLPEEGQHRATDGVEVHAMEDLDAAEGLADALRLEGEGHAADSICDPGHQQAGVSG